jgi:hypothetical protein
MSDGGSTPQKTWIDGFLDSLKSAKVDEPWMERAIDFKQPHLPKRIYKYRADNKYSLNNLSNDTVWMSSPDNYNDPYDCAFKIFADDIFKALSSTLVKEFLQNYGLDGPDGAEATKQAENSDDPFGFLKNYIAAKLSVNPGYRPFTITVFDPSLVRAQIDAATEFLNQVRATTKICSFSETNDNLLMWSHYAQNHQGFCLEYDLEPLDADHPMRKNLFPVIYSPDLYDMTPFMRGLVDSERKNFNPSLQLLGFLSKGDVWTYEREWRSISFKDRPMDDYNLPVPKPSRIFLGSKMAAGRAKELAEICKAKGIEVWQMKQMPDKFAVIAERYQFTS